MGGSDVATESECGRSADNSPGHDRGCVSVSISDFDTHADNFPRMRNLLPIVDFGLTALITDLEERGLLDQVAIVVWG
ncbi:MAG: DUF1501 domain-containing protein, partial [Planctomyces sp.]